MPIWIPLIMAALGTAVQSRQNKKAAKRSTNELRLGREKKKKVEGEQRADVLGEAEKFDPALRQSALDSKASETEARIKDVLAGNELETTGDVGVISDKLLSQRANSTREKANLASIMAALSSKVQAPKDAAFDENQGLSTLLADSKGRSSKLGRLGHTTDTLAGLEGRTNSTSMMIGGIMQALGMAGASNSIMSGVQTPGAGAVPYAGVPQATPVPGYIKPDAFGIR